MHPSAADVFDMSKTAKQLLDELLRYVEPPRGVAITVTESFPANANDPNWVAAMGATDSQRNAKFARKVADLRKTDATVDWSGIEERDGQKRRVAKWLSEL
jgi:hypothetical protein